MQIFKLQSSALVYAPGVVAWAINGFHFKNDRPALLRCISEGWNVPQDAARALLIKAVSYHLEGESGMESVVFSFESVAPAPAPRKAPRPRKLRHDDVKAELQGLGLTFRHRDGEFRVNYRGGTESTAYYTDDLEDARDTGRAMAAELAKRTRQLVTLRLPLSIARANALESFAV